MLIEHLIYYVETTFTTLLEMKGNKLHSIESFISNTVIENTLNVLFT